MLRRVTKAIRIRAALVLAILFGVCTISPSLALAFADATATHCLTDDHHGTTKLQKTHHAPGEAKPHTFIINSTLNKTTPPLQEAAAACFA